MMGTDDLFKKQRKARKIRKIQERKPYPDSFLIVTEGEKTEKFYFEGLISKIEMELGGRLDVVTVPSVKVYGEGCSTVTLVKKTEEILSKSNIPYQNIWVVFDKDDFSDFDEAIVLAKKMGYSVAWTNQSFEYWLFLHFKYSDSALHRHSWTEKVDESFREYQLGQYEKNLENLYELVSADGRVEVAVANAKRRMSNLKNTKPSTCDPATKVHLLVEKLLRYLEE